MTNAPSTAPVAVVTGASSGLGEATARRLAREGARVVLVARREDRLRALADELGGATVVAVDLLDDDAPAAIRAAIESGHDGRLDLLVNNAGTAWRSRFDEGGWENVRKTMAINFDAQVRVTEALLPLLRASAPAAIVNVSSVSGRVGRPGAGAYAASKFALAGWTDALRAEESAHGVHVGLVLPGFITTEGFPQQELVDHRWLRHIVGTPEQVAGTITEVWRERRSERYVPRYYRAVGILVALAPGLVARLASQPAATPAANSK